MFSKKDKEALYEIQLLSGRSLENTKDVFVGMLTWLVYRYCSGKEISFPLVGRFNIKYIEDELKEKGNQAILNMSVTPSPTFLRLIGQIKDGEKTDIEKLDEKKIQLALRKIVNT